MSCRPLDGICHSISQSHEIDGERGGGDVRSFRFKGTSVGGGVGGRKKKKRDTSTARTVYTYEPATSLGFSVCRNLCLHVTRVNVKSFLGRAEE